MIERPSLEPEMALGTSALSLRGANGRLLGRIRQLVGRLEQVNKELRVLLSLFAICLLLNHVIASQRMVLSLYVIPTLMSAYFYGRRQATLTTLASILLVLALYLDLPSGLSSDHVLAYEFWIELALWGGVLLVTGYRMGSLCEHKDTQLRELAQHLSRRPHDSAAFHLKG